MRRDHLEVLDKNRPLPPPGQRRVDDERRNWAASVELEEAQLADGTREALEEVV